MLSGTWKDVTSSIVNPYSPPAVWRLFNLVFNGFLMYTPGTIIQPGALPDRPFHLGSV